MVGCSAIDPPLGVLEAQLAEANRQLLEQIDHLIGFIPRFEELLHHLPSSLVEEELSLSRHLQEVRESGILDCPGSPEHLRELDRLADVMDAS